MLWTTCFWSVLRSKNSCSLLTVSAEFVPLRKNAQTPWKYYTFHNFWRHIWRQKATFLIPFWETKTSFFKAQFATKKSLPLGEGGLRGLSEKVGWGDRYLMLFHTSSVILKQAFVCHCLAAALSQNGSGVINAIHYRFATSLPKGKAKNQTTPRWQKATKVV